MLAFYWFGFIGSFHPIWDVDSKKLPKKKKPKILHENWCVCARLNAFALVLFSHMVGIFSFHLFSIFNSIRWVVPTLYMKFQKTPRYFFEMKVSLFTLATPSHTHTHTNIKNAKATHILRIVLDLFTKEEVRKKSQAPRLIFVNALWFISLSQQNVSKKKMKEQKIARTECVSGSCIHIEQQEEGNFQSVTRLKFKWNVTAWCSRRAVQELA